MSKEKQEGKEMRNELMAVVFMIGALLACNDSSSSSSGSSSYSQPTPARDEQAYSKGVYEYREVMRKVETDAPGVLSHMVKDVGRKPDQCEHNDENTAFDVCYWFFVSDSSVKVFTYTMAAEGGAGSNPDALVKYIIFARNNKVEKQISGAVQQLLDK